MPNEAVQHDKPVSNTKAVLMQGVIVRYLRVNIVLESALDVTYA